MQSSYDYSPVVPNFYNVTVTLSHNQGRYAQVYLVQNVEIVIVYCVVGGVDRQPDRGCAESHLIEIAYWLTLFKIVPPYQVSRSTVQLYGISHAEEVVPLA